MVSNFSLLRRVFCLFFTPFLLLLYLLFLNISPAYSMALRPFRYKVTVAGTVTSSYGNTPIESAKIEITVPLYTKKIYATTDSRGKYTLKDIPIHPLIKSSCTIKAFKSYYFTSTKTIILVPSTKPYKQDFILKPSDATSPTGTIKINNNNQYTNSSQVTLTLSAQDNSGGSGVSLMRFSNDNTTWSTQQAYTTTKSWTLSSSDGIKTVYVKFSDKVGNWSQVYSDTIILDTTAPIITLNPVATPTNKNVTLSYILTDNLTPQNELTLTGDNSPYANEGTHNVTLACQDLAGNSATASISFIIDKTPPVIVITSPVAGATIDTSSIELAGTIDGVAFSEVRTLAEGENVLTKTATDLAGNANSVSITINCHTGELIGFAGGEISSFDGTVSLDIPQGALDSPTVISITPVDVKELEGSQPEQTVVLAAAECKPNGTTFDQPVQITYNLEQTQVPGTPLELGYYDTAQGRIIPTGQTCVVKSDGSSVDFSLTHFSTYAVLTSFVPQGAPIGAGVKIPLPDMLTGSFGHSVSLTIPPGRKGMQPSLGLSYRSTNPNGWLGVGFSLESGYIVRSTRLGPPSYNDTTDTFYFITDSGTTELVYLVDNVYQAKIESSFTKFFKEGDTWRALAKDGSSLRFGESTDSKETAAAGTFSWHLTKAIDTNSNYVQYSYSKDQGKSYLARVEYTGNENGLAPTNSIDFFLESRSDIPSSYTSGSKISTSKRLKQIEVKANNNLVWRYVLNYEYSSDTNRSLLKSVTQYAADGTALPTQTFEYQGAE